MIQDPTLRALFRAESEDHLQKLDELLLQLERTPTATAPIEEAFREAHSMKGAARMLGLAGIQILAHKLEDSLNSARHGTEALSAARITQMLHEVSDIRNRVATLVGDDAPPPARAPMHVAAPVATTLPPPMAAPLPSPVPAHAAHASAEALNPAPAHESAPAPDEHATKSERLALDSVRVDTRHLDALMSHAGELVVTHTRVSRRLHDLDDALGLLAQLQRGKNAPPALKDLEQHLQQLYAAQTEDSARLETLSTALDEVVRRVRLLPLSRVFRLFPRMVRDLAHEQGKDVVLNLLGDDTLADKRILEEIKDPLMHLLRNAVDHGIEPPAQRRAARKSPTASITVQARQRGDRIEISVQDDGRGLDLEAIRQTALQRGLASAESLQTMTEAQVQRLILLPGFSTAAYVTDVSGRGVGMDVVRAHVDRLKGSLEVHSSREAGTRFVMKLPVTLSTLRVLLVQAQGQFFGLPAQAVLNSRRHKSEDVFTVEGRSSVLFRGTPVPLAPLAQALKLPPGMQPTVALQAQAACVLMESDGERFAVQVDALLDELEVVLKPLSPLVQGLPTLMGATLLNDGAVCTVLKPAGLLAAMPHATHSPQTVEPAAAAPRRKCVLLAEDSITTRAQEIRILEAAGYEVVAAADGREAFGKLGTRTFDALVSDVNMPHMDGLELAQQVRSLAQFADLPIILVTSLSSPADKRRGLEVGANAYITKPEFDQTLLLDCLERLIG